MPGAEPPSIVLDASVVVRWYAPEAGRAEALALFDQPLKWVAPRLLLTEVGAALRRKVLAGDMRAPAALDALAALLRSVRRGTIRLAADEHLVAPAFRLALLLEHKLPDCVYLALAEEEGAGVATADHNMARLASSRGVPTWLVSPSA